MSLEERVARIEQELAYVKGVLEQMDKRLTRLENEVAHLREEVRELNKRLDTLLRWVIGLILGMWTSIMCTLVPILLKLLGVI